MVALASVAALAVVLPLAAATAGPATRTEKSPRGTGRATGALGGGTRGAGARTSVPLAEAGNASGDTSSAEPSATLDGLGTSGSGRVGGSGVRDSARCGPELAAPEGVEAQTCVLRQGADTWARTYFRNATGGPLAAVLTLMDPDGRTVEVHCRMGPSDDPDGCETPHGRTGRDQRALDAYSAVAEIASADGKLLLRSGSNSPGDQAD
ncbi:hypothetical protein [Streptomyces sp. NPDC002537]